MSDVRRYLVLGQSAQDDQLTYFYVMAKSVEEAVELFIEEYLSDMALQYPEMGTKDVYVVAAILAPDGVAVEYIS